MSGLTLLASYPKSGNTWLRAFLTSHRRRGQAIDVNRDLARIMNLTSRQLQDRHAGLEHEDLTPEQVALLRPLTSRCIARDRPGLYKTHDSHLVPPGAREPAVPADVIDRVVYIVRDPRDVAVSAAHHFGQPLATSVANIADPTRILGRSETGLNDNVEHFVSSWSAHAASWIDAEAVNRLVLRYEDLVAQPDQGFARLCRFLDLDDTPDAVARSLNASAFATLAAQEARAGFRERLARASAPFFRSGRAGDWRRALPPALAGRIAETQGPMMARLGYL
ncbi:sulfotransferase domain-containing protein [Ancylobacter sp. IITR112]|uniref:sulfotransferase domain-containing protein n=1 Tax=Ancylobacter sp. IITR112 TaxID=3138073 RepID=UPI00352AEF20